jgi:hypothetical protein
VARQSLSHGREVLPDYEGVECSSLDEAYAETVRAIHDVYEECDGSEFDWNGWTLNALNAAGDVLFTLSLADLEGKVSSGGVNQFQFQGLSRQSRAVRSR